MVRLLPIALATLLLCGGGLLCAPAGAQEFDRAMDDPEHLDEAGVAPIRSRTGGGPRYVPEDFDPSLFPDPEPTPDASLRAEGEGVETRVDASVRLGGGHDTNVFRADRRRTADGFFHAAGRGDLLLRFPRGPELYVEAAAETTLYLERTDANEHFVSTFVEFFQPLSPWMEVGVQNAFEFSRLNLLDDNGDLFPRGRFGSLDEEARAFVILRPALSEPTPGEPRTRPLAIELGASYRRKDYEENREVESLDYEELRLDCSVSYRLSARPRSRLKLKYRFRRRDYDEFRARDRDRLVTVASPHLDLFRHQLNLTFAQHIDGESLRGRVVAALGLAYNRDLHENDRSYREGSASLRFQWWILRDWTRLETTVRGVARNFLVRRPLNTAGHLRHRLLTLGLGLWQALVEEPGQPALPRLALRINAAITVWRSGDFREDYDRYVVEAGLEAAW